MPRDVHHIVQQAQGGWHGARIRQQRQRLRPRVCRGKARSCIRVTEKKMSQKCLEQRQRDRLGARIRQQQQRLRSRVRKQTRHASMGQMWHTGSALYHEYRNDDRLDIARLRFTLRCAT